MINKRLLGRAWRFLFYVCLDVAAGTAIYVISFGEPDLTPGQLAIRILTGMALASAIVGGPDIMLYWQESGQRIKAEDERDAATKRADTAEQERDAAIKERDAIRDELRELRVMVEQMQTRRSASRSRRRRLRNNGQ